MEKEKDNIIRLFNNPVNASFPALISSMGLRDRQGDFPILIRTLRIMYDQSYGDITPNAQINNDFLLFRKELTADLAAAIKDIKDFYPLAFAGKSPHMRDLYLAAAIAHDTLYATPIKQLSADTINGMDYLKRATVNARRCLDESDTDQTTVDGLCRLEKFILLVGINDRKKAFLEDLNNFQRAKNIYTAASISNHFAVFRRFEHIRFGNDPLGLRTEKFLKSASAPISALQSQIKAQFPHFRA